MVDLSYMIKDAPEKGAEIPEKRGQWEGWIKPSIKEVVKGVAGTPETLYSLANSMALWPIQKVAGASRILAGGTAEEARETESQIGEAFAYQPGTEAGKGATELIGKGFDIALTPAKMAGEGITELVGSRAGYIAELASELFMFKMGHGITGISKTALKERATAKTMFDKKMSMLTKEQQRTVKDLAKQQGTRDLVKIERKKVQTELDGAYEAQKDIWLGNRDYGIHEAGVESRLLKKEIRDVNRQLKTKIKNHKIDEVIQVYIDTKRDPSHIEKYYDKLSPEKKKIVDLSQNLPEEIRAIADKIQKSYEDIGVEAMDADVIKNMLDDFASRRWDLSGKKGGDRKFGTTTGHAKQRAFKTIIEAWADPGFKYELLEKGATDNLLKYKEEIIKTIEDKRFVKALKGIKDIDGNPLVTTKHLEGYESVEHPNFKSWEWAGKEKAPEAKPVEAVKPYEATAYHGTVKGGGELKPSEMGESGPGIYLSPSKDSAKRWADLKANWKPDSGQKVLSYDVKLNKPFDAYFNVQYRPTLLNAVADTIGLKTEINKTGNLVLSDYSSPTEALKAHGYDGIVRRSGDNSVYEVVAFESKSLKPSKPKPPEVAKAKDVYGKNFFKTEDGTLYEKRELYAPKDQAKNLNNMLGISKLYDIPGVKGITKFNDITKAWILQTSLFHHLAFARSYYLGTNSKRLGEMNLISAYKEGIKAIEQGDPAVRLGVENGLTIGLKQDWNEASLRESTRIGKLLDRTKATKGVKDAINNFRQSQADFLFGELGAGLKAKSFMIEMRSQIKKYPGEDINITAKRVAKLINDDFGGLHLQRLGRNPTFQHGLRLLLLAPDWTESNVRTMVKTVTKLKGDARDLHLYRRFWGGVIVKGLGITAVANFISAGGDIDELKKQYREAWKSGHMNWAKMDVTPIYEAFGGKPYTKKYFSLVGHFQDPAKFIAHPIRSLKYKQSVVSGSAFEALSGSDWKGAKFTTLEELIDTGETVKWGKGRSIDWDQFPSYALSQIVGWQPIQFQNFIGYTTGEIDGFDALTKSIGLSTTTTYPKKGKGLGYSKYKKIK